MVSTISQLLLSYYFYLLFKFATVSSENKTFHDSTNGGFSSTRLIPTTLNAVDFANVGGGKISYPSIIDEEVGWNIPTASELTSWFTESFDKSKKEIVSLPSANTMSLQKNVSKSTCFNEHDEDEEVKCTIISKAGSSSSEGTRNATSIVKQIISELEFTEFSDVDMRGKHMKGISIGTTGLRCRHCKGSNKRRHGRYFPKSAKVMASNKFLIKAHDHFQSCSKYPKESKIHLYKLYIDHLSVREKPSYFRKRLDFCTEVWKSMQEYSSTSP